MTFGKKLKQIRLERGLSQDEFANILGTSKQVISRYETEQRTPKITVAQDYAKRLGLPFNYLIDDHSVIDDYLELNNHSSKFHELTYNLTEKLVRSAIWEEPVIK